jgi:hypothetical protein
VPPSPTGHLQPPPAGNPGNTKMIQLAVANTARLVNAAFANLAEQFDA